MLLVCNVSLAQWCSRVQLLPVCVYMAPTSATCTCMTDCHSVLYWSVVNATDSV